MALWKKKNNSKKFMADRHWRTFQEFIQMRRANAWNLFATFVFCWSHFSLRPNLILTQSNIPTCCYWCWDMQETHFTTLPVTFATSLSSLFFPFAFVKFSFVILNIVQCCSVRYGLISLGILFLFHNVLDWHSVWSWDSLLCYSINDKQINAISNSAF